MIQTLGAFLLFGSFSLLFLAQCLPDWSTHILGGQQDTRIFLWNLWWFKQALDQGLSPFYTSTLFHPFGVSLISHDYPLWNSVLGYLAQRAGGSIELASNLTFWLTWTLNGFCSYLLAKEVVAPEGRSRGPMVLAAMVAGLYVMTHSYTLARAMQNWGQFNLFSIPLFLWALVRLRRTGRLPDAVLVGATLAFNAACHYYFLIYAVSLWLGWLAWKIIPWKPDVRFQVAGRRRWRVVTAILSFIGGVAATAIVAHPGTLEIFNVQISARTPANALLVFWISLAAFAASWGKISWRRSSHWTRRDGLEQGIVAATATFFLMPLILGALQVFLNNDYPKQSILWKTHPKGVDLTAIFLPNPLHVFWGPAVSRLMETLHFHPQEQASMIGWTCLGLLLWAGTTSRKWLFLAASSTVMAMGAYLHVLDIKTWLPLPFYFWRLIPVLGNVRFPERWMAVGVVAWGVLLALALVALARRRRWSLARLSLIAGVLVLFENWPRLPSVRPHADEPAYAVLRVAPPGGILTLPFYAGDSSIGVGNALSSRFIFPWDHLGAQIHHGHPISGGFVGRIPRRLIEAYKKDPFFNDLIRLEEGQPALLPKKEAEQAACRAAQDFGLTYALIYDESTPPEALHYVAQNLPLIVLCRQADLALYRVDKFTCSKRLEK